MSPPLPPKKEVALALLERSSVHIHLDPRAQGVVVPGWFKKQPQLVLQVGLNMPVPIPDLRLDEDGISCTLSFNRTPFFCVLPWISVYALVGDDGRGMVWPDNVPPEVANQALTREGESAKRAGPRRVPSASPSPISASGGSPVGGVREASVDDKDPAASKAKKPKKRTRTDGPRAGVEVAGPARANLVAIPSASSPRAQSPAESSRPASPQAATTTKKTPRPEQLPPAPNVVPAERRPNAASPRPKRELPPYLRVVK
jgi:stringent starvation protein B